MTTKTHYEEMIKLMVGGNRKRSRKLIEETAAAGVNDVWKVFPLALGKATDQHNNRLPGWKDAAYQDLTTLQYELARWALEHQDDPYSYAEYLNGSEFQGLFHYLIENIPPGHVHTTMQLNHQM
jgi:hypothetical protein